MTDSRKPAAPLAPVTVRRGSRDVIVVAVLLIGALIVGIALGFRLGSQSSQIAAVPSPNVQPTPGPTAPATPLIEPTFPPYPVQPAVISDELRDAYYRGRQAVSVCIGYAEIVCTGRDGLIGVKPTSDTITSQEFEALFNAGPVIQFTLESIFVVEDLGDRYVEGVLFNEDSFEFGGQEISAVNPGGAGVFFMSLSGIDDGRSVLVVRSIPLAPLRPGESLNWEANVIAFEMTY